MFYTLIAYKPSTYLHCGCVIKTYKDAFEFLTTENRDELITLYANLLFQQDGFDTYEPKYEFTLLIDGRHDAPAEFPRIMVAAQRQAQALIAAKKLKQEQEKAATEAQAIAQREQRERKLLAELLVKYQP